MDLKRLAALVAIADHGSFSAAARALHTVQSNVSTRIAQLERELGVTLVDRQRGGLTAEGALVVERARRILRELEAVSADMASRNAEVAGMACIGVIGTTGRWLMPHVLRRLSADHPRVRAIIAEGSTSSLLPRLGQGQLDAVIVHLPVDDPDVDVQPLFAEDLIVLCHADHPLAAYDELPLDAVAEHPIMLPPPGTGLRRVIDQAAADAGCRLTALAEIDGVRLLTSLAFEGFGPAFVPATAVPRWLSGEFQRVRVPELPQRLVGWASHRRHVLSAPARTLHGLVLDMVTHLGALQPGVHVGCPARDGEAPAR
jgi:LysR family hydrogen peroxide-inducible transcriptional activator